MIRFLVFIFALSLFSCRKGEIEEGANSIKAILHNEISSTDPAVSYDAVSAEVVYQLYETLYEYEYLKRPYTIQPLLAEEMPLIEDGGKRYVIKLKKNIEYHAHPAFKGQKRFVKAQDLISQIKRIAFAPTASTGWWVVDGKVKGINTFRNQAGSDLEKLYNLNVEGLKAIDDHTLVIELLEPYPQLINAMTLTFLTPIPMEVIKYHNNELNEVDAGTGPFILKEINRNVSVKLKRFDNYHTSLYPTKGDRYANDHELLKDANRKIPFLNEIHFAVIKEERTRWLNFRANKVDFIQLPKDYYATAIDEQGDLDKELKKEDIQYQIVPTITYWWLAFNMKDQLLGKNRNLRMAIAHAIDWERYLQLFTNNVGQKANSIYPPGIPGYNPSKVLPYEYDVEKAKDFLKKAGYPNGKNLPVFKFDIRMPSAVSRQKAEYIQKELDKIGIKIEIIVNAFPAFLNKARTGQLQFWQGGWITDYPDAENILQLLITKNHPPGPNTTYYSNAKVDALFEKFKVLPDGAQKFEIMDEIESLVTTDLPWIMQYYERNYVLHHSRVKNFRHSDIIFNFYKYLRIQDK